MNPLISHQRQVHLDFHTSPCIPDVASEFDPKAFARTFKRAHVNSVTLFAKCHHGMCYYPTTTGTAHPALAGRDLLGEQIEALRAEGIRAPIYTTVGWEEDAAARFPQWRQMRRDGTFSRIANPDPSLPPHPGGWWYLNFIHPDYQDYIEAHLRELFSRYEIDGIFFDILLWDPQACWSDASRRFREKHGLLADDPATQFRFVTATQVAFSKRFTTLIRGLKKDCTIFYNTANPICADSRYGARARHRFQTHWELESLPSGYWGYQHFPRLARACSGWGKPWLGMTGRFQRSWGDFGGLKPLPALEYECFRSQALGGANSIGDQLPPRGTLDQGAYDLIGQVYTQWETVESFYNGSQPLPQIGIVAPGDPTVDSSQSDKSIEGVVQMCEEAHYDAIVLDDSSSYDVSQLELVILPDSVVITPALQTKLATYLKQGGKLIVSHLSGFIAEHGLPAPRGKCLLHGLNLTSHGEVTNYPTYWRSTRDFSSELSRSDRVVYAAGLNITAERTHKVLIKRVLPYFRRTDLTFSSHFHTPPQAKADHYPAAIAGKNFVYFADPIFREYRQDGNIAVRDAFLIALRNLIGDAPYGAGLPSTILSVPRRRDRDLLLTLLHYIPTRKALAIDMIEERGSFAGEHLKLPAHVTRVIDYASGNDLSRNPDGSFILPTHKGRLLLIAPKVFPANKSH